jgi:hypothetical protein
MQPALVNAYAAMLPRLQAEELLLFRAAVQSATGGMKKEDDREWVRNLQRLSRAPAGRRIRTLDDLRATGMRVVEGG